MSKRTIATSYQVGSKDETGAFVDFTYTCPYCDFEGSEIILVGASNLDKVDNDFETDRECLYCGKDIIVECR